MSEFYPTQVRPAPTPASPYDSNAPAAHTAASAVLPGANNNIHVVSGISWSTAGSGTLSSGGTLLTVLDGTTVVRTWLITSQGPGFIPCNLQSSPGNSLTVTVADPGANITATVNFDGHYTLPAPPNVVNGYDFSLPSNSMYL